MSVHHRTFRVGDAQSGYFRSPISLMASGLNVCLHCPTHDAGRDDRKLRTQRGSTNVRHSEGSPMQHVWYRDDHGFWTTECRGSVLTVTLRSGSWSWEATVNGDLMRRGTEPTSHLAKIAAMKAAEVITNEGA